jgi:hypothetical protein
MTTRDIATITFKALSAWLFASGVAGLCSALLTWTRDVERYGDRGPAALGVTAAAIFLPIGAIGWLISDGIARRIFPGHAEPVALSLTRADLYAFASVFVGLCLLAEAIPMIVFWLTILMHTSGAGGWSAASNPVTNNGVTDSIGARAQAGSLLAKAVLGAILLAGPERIGRALVRIRRELSGRLGEPESAVAGRAPSDRGGA